MEYLRGTPQHVAVAAASGVLYHVVSPVELLARIARVADTAFIWTHHYDEALLLQRPNTTARSATPETAEYEGSATRCIDTSTVRHWATPASGASATPKPDG